LILSLVGRCQWPWSGVDGFVDGAPTRFEDMCWMVLTIRLFEGCDIVFAASFGCGRTLRTGTEDEVVWSDELLPAEFSTFACEHVACTVVRRTHGAAGALDDGPNMAHWNEWTTP